MGLGTVFKANKALKAQKNGNKQEAMRLYEECFNEGLADMRYVLSYAVLLIRDGQYQKARELLVKYQKLPMQPEQRINMIVDYSACVFRMGDTDKAVEKLEELSRKHKSGLIYQTLGYLYVEQFDPKNREAFLTGVRERQAAEDAAAAERAAKAQAVTGEEPESGEAAAAPISAAAEEAPVRKTPEEILKEGIEKALAFNREAVDYDDEDPICLDNMGQFLYRVLEDRAEAKQWFDKAHEIKETQIDTLYFLSRYDLEAGDKAAALEKLKTAAEGSFSPLNYCTREEIEAEIARLKGE